MLVTEEKIMELCDWKERAKLRAWVIANGWDLLAPGKKGKVSAYIREGAQQTRRGEPNFAALAQERGEAG